MTILKAKQRNINFSFCPHPVTIDKSKDWGEGNIQQFPNGVYFKHDDNNVITHRVQPCSDNPDVPEGWIKQSDGLFQKNDIFWIKDLFVGTTEKVETLDGVMDYKVKVPSSLVCQNKNGKPNVKDSWVISNVEMEKLYE